MRFLLTLVLLTLSLGASAATQPLTKANRYFTDPAGRVILMTGSHNWQNLQDFFPTPFDFTNYVALLVSTNHSYARLWQMDEPQMTYFHGGTNVLPFPFLRPGPGVAADGLPKYDLATINPAYLLQLTNRLAILNSNSIYAGVQFFDGWWFHGNFPASWTTNQYNPTNNINGTALTTNTVFTASDSTWYALITNYVTTVVIACNPYPNVTWEIGNEMPSQSRNFQSNLVSLIKTVETSLPFQHPVGVSALDFYAQTTEGIDINSWLTNVTAADWVALSGASSVATWTNNPPPATTIGGSQVLFLDSDHTAGDILDSPTVWRQFTRGYNVLYMDPYGITGEPAVSLPARRAMGDIRRYASRLLMSSIVPTTNVSTTGFTLTNSLKQYLVYSPTTSSFGLTNAAGYYYYEWFDPTASLVRGSGFLRADGTRYNFTPPATHTVDAVLLLLPYPSLLGGLDFDGSNDAVSAGSAAITDDLSNITVTAWIFPRTQGNAGFGRIYSKENTNGGTISFCIGDRSGVASNLLIWQRGWSTASGVWHTPANSLLTNNWYHVAVTYNTGSTANDPLLYINGVSQTVTEWVTPSGTLSSDASFLNRIGNSQNMSAGFNGLIQEVRLYNKLLSAADIALLYNSRSRLQLAGTNCVAYWPLNSGTDGTGASGSSIPDRSGNGNTGTGSGGSSLMWRSGPILSN